MRVDDVSVVIPTHNRIDCLLCAIDSVAGQCRTIVVVDDGSLLSVYDQLNDKQFESSDLRILRNEIPLGAAAARNRGSCRIESEWLLFLDDDDQLTSHYLKNLMKLIESKLDVSAWIPNYVGLRQHVFGPVPMEDVQARNLVGGCSGLCIRKSLFDSIGGFDGGFPSMQDWDLWIRLIQQRELYYSGLSGVTYTQDSTHKITHDLSAKYGGLRRLYFKHQKAWSSGIRREHLVRLWALRQLREPSGPRLVSCLLRVLQWPAALGYFLKWRRYL